MSNIKCSNCWKKIHNPEYIKYNYCDNCHTFNEKQMTIKQELLTIISAFILMVVSLIILGWMEYRDNKRQK